MANTDTVKVAVEIVDKFSDDLRELEAKLDKIDSKRLSVALDIDDGGDIEEIKALLESLEKDLKTVLDIDVRGEKQAAAIKKALARDATATITYLTNGGEIPGGGGRGTAPFSQNKAPPIRGGEAALQVTDTINDLIDNHLKRLTIDGNPDWAKFNIDRQGRLFDLDGERINLKSPETDFLQSVSQAGVQTGLGPDVPMGPMRDRPGIGSSADFERSMKWSRRKNMLRNIPRNLKRMGRRRVGMVGAALEGLSESASMSPVEVAGLGTSIKKSLRKLKPTMTKWMNLIALAVPMLITLAGAAVGVASAFLSIAGAGAAMIGLGILGYGDSLAESMEMASRRVRELKGELFDVLRPASAAFQPLLEGFLGTIPGAAGKLVDPLQGLSQAGFGSFFNDSIIGAAEWIGELVTMITELSPEIRQLGMLFGRIFGDVLIDLMEWSIKELYNNQQAFLSLGKIVGDILIILYNVSKAVSFALTAFRPLFDILVAISDLLSNRWAAVVMAFIASAFLAAKSVYALLGALAILKGAGLAGAVVGLVGLIKMMYVYIGAAFEAIGVTTALAATLSMVTLGLSAIAGIAAAGYGLSKINTGPAGGNRYSSGSGYGTSGGNSMTLVVQGDMSNRTYQRVKDDFPSWYGTRENINDNTQR